MRPGHAVRRWRRESPWFSDWGRDTMIALPGLLIANRRADVAEAIVRGFAPFVDGGMLPNVFPDGGNAPEYNTVDAALWYVEAIRACALVTRDPQFAHDLFPVLRAIVDGYMKGTRYGIGVDPDDGLVRAGVPGVQLTWMDAKVGDHVVTPRIGKPIEINALWFAALKTSAHFAEHCGADPRPYEDAAGRVRDAFEKFWNGDRGCCFDVLDGPDGNANCGRRSACARLRRAIRTTSAGTAAIRPRATAPIIKAPCGRGCWARSFERTSTSTAIRHWRARSSRRSPTRSMVTASERWARSSTATLRTRRAARSRRPGALPN